LNLASLYPGNIIVLSYFENSSELGLPDHYTIEKVIPQHSLGMLCTLALSNTKPRRGKKGQEAIGPK
jgi:hypothetical protein